MDNAEAKALLIAEAKSLGIRGVLENMKPDTLKKKIAEAKGETSVNVKQGKPSTMRKFAKFVKDKN